MSNLLNATINYNDNILPARKLKSSRSNGYIEAPQSIYKYSLNDELNEVENFRKESLYNSKQEEISKEKSKKRAVYTAGAVAALLGMIFFTKKK